MTLHSVLGIPRVKKRSSSSAAKRASSSSSAAAASAISTWAASLARTKPGTGTAGAGSKAVRSRDDTDDRYHKKLSSLGPASLPVPLPSLPATASGGITASSSSSSSSSAPSPVEMHERILATMFSPLPGNGTGKGLGSARIATVLQFRAAVPRVVSLPHLLQALLLSCSSSSSSFSSFSSPAAAERAIAASVRRGEGRRVRIPTLLPGGTVGAELFVRTAELEALVGRCAGLREDGVGDRFLAWLRQNPGRERLVEGEGGLGRKEVDALVRAGFLTAVNSHGGGGGGSAVGAGALLRARPEARHSSVSIETVARAAAGTAAAVGGEGVLHAAGGTGVRNLGPVAEELAGGGGGEFSVAVPGSGVFLKLASAALEHLADLLRRSPYREMSESDLREKWDGGVVGDGDSIAQAKKARGEFAGVMPGRTKKWKEFHGLAFDWVLREAVGAGMVEVFETQTVGRGVRLI
ncbi:hypothetical protein VTH82DRAFT_3607 [Thermothelomyces myriococcoides]